MSFLRLNLLNYSSLSNQLSRKIRTGSSLKIYSSCWNKKNSRFTFYPVANEKRNITETREIFHRNTRTTVSEYWVEEKEKRKIKQKQQQIYEATMKIHSFFARLSFRKMQRRSHGSVNIFYCGVRFNAVSSAIMNENRWKFLRNDFRPDPSVVYSSTPLL